jgi:hypothetical protein
LYEYHPGKEKVNLLELPVACQLPIQPYDLAGLIRLASVLDCFRIADDTLFSSTFFGNPACASDLIRTKSVLRVNEKDQ